MGGFIIVENDNDPSKKNQAIKKNKYAKANSSPISPL